MKRFFWLAVCLTLPALALAADGERAIYSFAWKIVNFVAGLAAIILVGRIVWATQETDDRGGELKTAIRNMLILAVAWGIASTVLTWAANSGTSVKGISAAVNLK